MSKFSSIILVFFIFFSSTLYCDGFLKTSGKDIVNSSNEKILLRGINLGNWLIQEGYMMQTSSFANTETEIRNRITALIGEVKTAQFYKAWNENYITKKDIDQIAKWGFNSIRLPLHYAKLTPKDQPGVYLEDGFATIDKVLSWCEENKIYLILDLHAAHGSQNGANISDCTDGQARLWTDPANQDRTVELWKKLAERYSNKEWIGGYDLINETVYNFPQGNITLWNFMSRITTEIRKVDPNHIIFIEGNWWGTDFGGLPSSLWDKNLVLSFHKYWNQTDQGTINYLLNLRNTYNVPLWLGETGENSNAWFTECIELMERNNIGYCFWPYKKIASISGLTTIPTSAEYQSLLNYWSKGGVKPSIDFAFNTLMNLVNNLSFDNCKINKDVVDAMFRQVNNTAPVPYASNNIPGIIYATNYDMGKPGSAYSDKIYKKTNSSDAYNNGWSYRNDGVDIEPCSNLFSNGFNVGWIEVGEWLSYTIDVTKEGNYAIKFDISGGNSGGMILVRINGYLAGDVVNVPYTGGWQSWKQIDGPNGIHLTAGTHQLLLQFLGTGFNLSTIQFVTDLTSIEDNSIISEYKLEQNYPNPFNPSTTIKYQLRKAEHVKIKLFDQLGSEMAVLVNESQNAGNHTIKLEAGDLKLSSGIYYYQISAGSFVDTKKLLKLK